MDWPISKKKMGRALIILAVPAPAFFSADRCERDQHRLIKTR